MRLLRLEVLRCPACGALALAVGGPGVGDPAFRLTRHTCAGGRWEALLSEVHPLDYVLPHAFERASDARRGVTQPRGGKRVGTASVPEGGKK
jgi:hypothetical protein